MGVANLVSSSGGGGLASAVKSVQRGEAVSAGTITISSVDTTKTQVSSFSTGAAGTVAATGAIGASTGNTAFSYWGSYAWIDGYAGGTASAWKPANIAFENYFNGPHAQYGGRYGQTLNGYYFSYATATNSLSYISLGGSNITGGSTNVTSASYGAYLSGATSLVVTGPCRYEVVEYY